MMTPDALTPGKGLEEDVKKKDLDIVSNSEVPVIAHVERSASDAPVASFTSGPWWASPHYHSDVESREGRICECFPFSSPRAWANAQLIAAAPEMFIALKRILALPIAPSERNGALKVLLDIAREVVVKTELRQR